MQRAMNPHAQTAAALAKDVLAVHAAEVDSKARFPAESIAALGKAGLMGLCIPTALGGKGEGPRAYAEVVEELAQVCASTAMIYVMHVTAGQAISASTTLQGKDDVLRAMAAGKHLTTLAFSEKGSRSQFWAPVSKLIEKGDGWTTNAQKSWVTSAHHADSFVSSGQKPGAASPRESTRYFVRTGAPTIRANEGFDGMGLRGNDSTPVTARELRDRERGSGDAAGRGRERDAARSCCPGSTSAQRPWRTRCAARASRRLPRT